MGYFERALLAAAVLGALSGLVGSLVVLRKRAFFAQALTHATFPGAVAAALLGVNVLFGAAVAAVMLMAVMTVLGRISRVGGSVASGIVLTTGFALGALLQATNPSVPVQVEGFLVGSILTVTPANIGIAGALLAVAIVTLALTGKEILYSTFDPTGFRAAGYREWTIELITLGLVTATVVVSMPAVGSILAIALLAAPAAATLVLARTSMQVFAIAPVVGAVSAVTGVLLSRTFAVSAGAAIALTAAAFFLGAVAFSRLRGIRWVR
ncbi:metal ABC transporter permease [Planctomonas psychrotolerans]|uniref:metal ABC transporter permease n=1 Tax=Planctomonas psychrotolerans TaxID=2528712 RepID=UPI00123BCE1C|nr:metal ABC transporter permease [Planctomonas psychrotolerans]